MNDYKYDMGDLVIAAAQQKPLDFESAFNDLILDRINSAVNDKKIAVAQQMYGYIPPENNEEESED
jgi:hypothetical protein